MGDSSNRDVLARDLERLLGIGAVLTGDSDRLAYGKDWTAFAKPDPSAVALPADADQVAAVLRFCSERNLSVVPSGGRTGLAGGAVAARGELVLSLERLRHISPADTAAQTVRVGAGVVNQALQESLAADDLFWPVELGSKGSCQVGGNIATNAGGVRVIRYGHARHWVQSLEVVLASGERFEANGQLEKNNTGYDFRHLISGSEGTLGIVTAATLRLSPRYGASRVLLAGLGSMPAVLATLRSARARRLPLLAFECFTRACLESVCAQRGHADPLTNVSPYYVLVEVEESGDSNRLDAWLEELMEEGLLEDGTVSQGAHEVRRLWEFREGITESLSHRGLVYKNDLALPLACLDEFTRSLLEHAPQWYSGCQLFFFGHIGDGNLHVNVIKPPERDAADFLKQCERANEPLFTLVQRLGGSIAAEHGIGLLKKHFLRYSRTDREIELMRSIKRAFDPKCLLNPGKIFD